MLDEASTSDRGTDSKALVSEFIIKGSPEIKEARTNPLNVKSKLVLNIFSSKLPSGLEGLSAITK